MNKKRIKVIIGLISTLIIFAFGLYNLLIDNIRTVPVVILTVGGLIGTIGYIIELKKVYSVHKDGH